MARGGGRAADQPIHDREAQLLRLSDEELHVLRLRAFAESPPLGALFEGNDDRLRQACRNGAPSKVDIKPLIGPHTRVIDLKGRRVVPGFYDSHVHLLGSGLRLAEVALKDAKDEAEFGRRLREFDRKLPRDRWLTGGEWDHDRTFNGVLPTAEQAKAGGIDIVNTGAQHTDLSDRGPDSVKGKIQATLDQFLGDSAASDLAPADATQPMTANPGDY